MQRVREGLERPTDGLRPLDADSGPSVREDTRGRETGREDGLAQEGPQHGREEVVDVRSRRIGMRINIYSII